MITGAILLAGQLLTVSVFNQAGTPIVTAHPAYHGAPLILVVDILDPQFQPGQPASPPGTLTLYLCGKTNACPLQQSLPGFYQAVLEVQAPSTNFLIQAVYLPPETANPITQSRHVIVNPEGFMSITASNITVYGLPQTSYLILETSALTSETSAWTPLQPVLTDALGKGSVPLPAQEKGARFYRYARSP